MSASLSLVGALSAGCLVAGLETRLQERPGLWVERQRIEVVSNGACRELTLEVPEGTVLTRRDAWLRLGDGRKVRLDAARFVPAPPGLDGAQRTRLPLPDLVSGDRLFLVLESAQSSEQGWSWAPGEIGAAWATLTLPSALPAQVYGRLGGKAGRWWVGTPGADVGVRVFAKAAPPGESPPGEARSGERAALDAMSALEQASRLRLLPVGADDPRSPIAGEAAFARGWADPRGFARTVVALTQGGPDTVVLAEDLHGELAVWEAPTGPQPLLHPDDPRRAGAAGPARAQAHVVATLDLLVPEAEPQAALQPGGAARARWEAVIGFQAGVEPRWWSLPLPDGTYDLEVQAPEGVTWRPRPHDLLVLLPASRAPVSLRVRHHSGAVPTWGEVPVVEGERHSLVVRAPGGEVRWEPGDDQWWLASIHDSPVLASRAVLLDGLDWRLRAAAAPEPALPLSLKRLGDQELLAEHLRRGLQERAAVAPLAVPLTQPRPLQAALRSGVVTPGEAAWVLHLWAKQAGIAAEWAWVRPAERGPGSTVSPAGFTEGAVLLQLPDGPRWIDVGCHTCAPFELRPALEAASVLGFGPDKTPPPSVGQHLVSRDGDRVIVRLEGPPALLVREGLWGVPNDARVAWLTEGYGAPGARLERALGVERAGSPITLVFVSEDLPHALRLPAPDARDDTWWVWPGVRSQPAEGPDFARSHQAFELVRADGLLRLDVRQRSWDAEDRAAYEAAIVEMDTPPPPPPPPAAAPEGAPERPEAPAQLAPPPEAAPPK